jgi:hypothetical protein
MKRRRGGEDRRPCLTLIGEEIIRYSRPQTSAEVPSGGGCILFHICNVGGPCWVRTRNPRMLNMHNILRSQYQWEVQVVTSNSSHIYPSLTVRPVSRSNRTAGLHCKAGSITSAPVCVLYPLWFSNCYGPLVARHLRNVQRFNFTAERAMRVNSTAD